MYEPAYGPDRRLSRCRQVGDLSHGGLFTGVTGEAPTCLASSQLTQIDLVCHYPV
jgi:hypothetical protein